MAFGKEAHWVGLNREETERRGDKRHVRNQKEIIFKNSNTCVYLCARAHTAALAEGAVSWEKLERDGGGGGHSL